MNSLKGFVIIGVLFFAVSLVNIGVCWFLKIRRWDQLLLLCAVSGGVLGMLLSLTSGMTAFSKFPAVAVFIGTLMGMMFGLVSGGMCLSIGHAVRSKQKSKK